jgi:hypothetical protein
MNAGLCTAVCPTHYLIVKDLASLRGKTFNLLNQESPVNPHGKLLAKKASAIPIARRHWF